MTERIPLLAICHLTPDHQAQISEHFELIYVPKPEQRAQALAEHGPRIRAVLTIGSIGMTRAEQDAMPALELVCCLGVGYEQLDLPYLHGRGIVVANGAGTNANCVADHAFALVLAVVRQIRNMDRACRAGQWRVGLQAPAQPSGKRLGIFGMGAIGDAIARRAQGFDMPVAYCNRRPRAGVDFPYFEHLADLAAWSDILVVAAPGGAGTHHAVNAEVLRALGPKGVLVNIGRGSIVDTAALAQALREQAIAGAGLDVYESEPAPPEELIGLDNLTISPHIAGWSPEAVQATVDRFLANARGHFDGSGVISPVATG
jgi:lactate dehydrogenase-like 2-hydroxyacid dehydrogenase